MQSTYFSRPGPRQGKLSTHSTHSGLLLQLLSDGMDENNHAVDEADLLNNLMTVAGGEGPLRSTRATIEVWFASGALPHYRLGPKTIRIARSDLEDFLANRRLTSLPGSRFDK